MKIFLKVSELYSENSLPTQIASKSDLHFFLECDRLSLGYNRKKPKIVGDETWQFQRLLRKVEFYKNCRNSFLWKPLFFYHLLHFHRMSVRLGFTIPPNCFGPGLAIVHRGTIVISNFVKIGSNCRIHVDVNIGATSKQNRAPQIGNDTYIAPGVKIFGDITIADGVAIGAGAIVNKSILEKNITVAGNPAKKISDNNSGKHINKGTEIFFKTNSRGSCITQNQ
ncbi:serine O-acetyltransferase [Methanospirillum stamsii]|uniref:Serine acetyltransferase n=1 Tax=Methanospirillum stamsii TaxID=1277351 RepID=A0A2V2N6B5_9EURY|nr:serine acetyltransferase [Methanospirillum stamsii]PWR71777.1 serine acetyltransferase [Methanospirillum stamsii]